MVLFRGSALVGRRRELQRVLGLVDRASEGHATVLMLTGEPGIGKTRFMVEIGTNVSQSGGQYLSGIAFEAEGMPPYLPLLQALRQYVVSTPAELLAVQLGANANTLAGILPEIHMKLGRIQEGLPLPVEQARLRLYDAIADLFSAIATASPLLLGLDDLDQADPATLELICHIVRRQPEARLLIIGAFREDRIAHILAFERALAELSRLRRSERMTLTPLSSSEMNDFARQLLAGPVSSELIAHLMTHSEGNPFFAEELLRDWIEAGNIELVREDTEMQTWSLIESLPAQIPKTIVSAIRQRLSRLPSNVVDQLRIASVIGATFSLDLLSQASGLDSIPLCDLMQIAEEAHLVQSIADDVFAFSHAKIRECLYSEVSSARRHVLHEKIGMAIEAQMRTEGVDLTSEVAHHYVRSSDHQRGAHFSRLAAEKALEAYSLERALEHYQNAIRLSKPTSPEYGETMLDMANAALQFGNASQAQESFQAAELWYRARGDLHQSARARHGLGKALWHLDELYLAEDAFKQALARFLSLGAIEDAIKVQVDAAELIGLVLGRGEEGLELSGKALALAQTAMQAELQISSSRVHGFLQVLENKLEYGIELLENAQQAALKDGRLIEAAETFAALAQAHVWSADFDRSLQVSLQREDLARTNHIPESLAYVYSWIAFLNAARGEWVESENQISLAEKEVLNIPSLRPSAFLHQIKGFLALQRGEYSTAKIEFTSALEIFREKDPLEYILCVGLLGVAHSYLGEGQLARRAIDEQESILSNTRIDQLPAASVKSTLCFSLGLLGEHARQISYQSDLVLYSGQHHWFLVDRILGETAIQQRDWGGAAGFLQKAEELALTEGLKPELARTYLSLAHFEIARSGPGSAERARDNLGKARAILEVLGHKPGLKTVRILLADLPSQPRSSRFDHPSGDLSSRELEVLRQLAGGRSNREIAEELVLSESTVAKHLTSIYTKLGVENRTAAIAAAIRRGLA